jgi:hypothetical protein
MYAIIKHGQVLATGTLEGMFISNIFPLSDTPEWKAAHDVYEVVFPQYNPETHYLVPIQPIINGTKVTLHQPAPLPPAQPDSEPVETITLTESSTGADSV